MWYEPPSRKSKCSIVPLMLLGGSQRSIAPGTENARQITRGKAGINLDAASTLTLPLSPKLKGHHAFARIEHFDGVAFANPERLVGKRDVASVSPACVEFLFARDLDSAVYSIPSFQKSKDCVGLDSFNSIVWPCSSKHDVRTAATERLAAHWRTASSKRSTSILIRLGFSENSRSAETWTRSVPGPTDALVGLKGGS